MTTENRAVEVFPRYQGTENTLNALLAAGKFGKCVGWGIWRTMNECLQDVGAERLSAIGQEIPVEWNGLLISLTGKVRWEIRKGNERVVIWDLWNWIKRPPKDEETALSLYSAIMEVAREFNVKPRGFFGHGNLASPILRKNDVLSHLPSDNCALNDCAAKALFGGRIQSVIIGHIDGPVYEYDLNSAYAWALTALPSLSGSEWANIGQRALDGTFWCLCEVEWKMRSSNPPIYPFPVRLPGGQVEYPRQGNGWFWSPLVKEALEHWPTEIRVLTTKALAPSTDAEPFAFANSLYTKRLGLSTELQQTIAKWTLSALWGKLCQYRGMNNQLAEFQCLEWAGMATSLVNAELLRATMTNPKSVIMFQVDSILSREPLRQMETGLGLGQWKINEYNQAQVYQPGFWRGRRRDGTWKEKTRGVPEGCFDWRYAEREWDHFGANGRVPVEWKEFFGANSQNREAPMFGYKVIMGIVPLRPGGIKIGGEYNRPNSGKSRIWEPREVISEGEPYSPGRSYRLDHGADNAQQKIQTR